MGTSSIFTGNSRYSADFQSAIDRATAIASLPISLLNNQVTALNDQTTALTGLDTQFQTLQSAVAGIGTALNGSAFDATISDPTKLSVSLGDGAVEGNYSVEVTNAGVYAASMTAATWANDSGAAHRYQVSIGGTAKDLTVANNSAGSVASAINAQFGDQVRASVVNVGSVDAPDLRVSLQATSLEDLNPDILLVTPTEGGGDPTITSLQGYKTTGVKAHYIVNGVGTGVDSTSRSVSIATGITVNLKAADIGNPVNITVTRSTSALSDALQTFTTAYNATVDLLDKQHGQTTGALSGQSLVGDLSQALSQVVTYSSSSQISGLGSLGVDLDATGHLTFNAFNLLSADLTNSSGVTSFLGSATGGGFLKSVSDILNRVEQTDTGLLPSAEANAKEQVTGLTNSIADQQTRVDDMKARMQAQMAAADALIATMEQQYNYLSGMFSAMQTASQQYR